MCNGKTENFIACYNSFFVDDKVYNQCIGRKIAVLHYSQNLIPASVKETFIQYFEMYNIGYEYALVSFSFQSGDINWHEFLGIELTDEHLIIASQYPIIYYFILFLKLS